MVAGLDDPALVQHHQPIQAGDGGQAVGDGDHRLAPHQGFQAFLDRRLDFRVQRRGGLVHDQDRRILEQHAGNGDALALAAGELHAALADVGVEPGATLGIGKLGDELVGAGLANRFPEFLVAGAGAAVEQVVADRTVQQRGVLGDHADVGAQAFLAQRGDVLSVDQDAPALQVVQAQEQVDQGRLARARRPDQADLLAGADLQVEPGDDSAALSVVEVDVLEAHLAVFHLQHARIVAVGKGDRLHHGVHAVLDDADVLEDAVDHPHDPAGHVVDADDQRGSQSDGAYADLAVAPQPQGEPGGAGDQHAVHADDADVHRADHARLLAETLDHLAHRGARVALLVLGVGEQLEGGDVGVAVDHPAHQLRACRRGGGGAALDARYEVTQRRDVADDPQGQRDDQPPVRLGEQE